MIEVGHTDKLTQFFENVWNCEGLNDLNFFWYGHNPVTSDVITQIVKFVDLEPSLLEADEHLFEESKIFCPRDFCNMQKVIDVSHV